MVRAQQPLVVRGDLLLQGNGLPGAPRRPVRHGQVAPGSKGVGVVRAQEPLSVGGDLLVQGDGLPGAPSRPVRHGQVAPGGEGVEGVGVEEALVVGGDLSSMAMASSVRPADQYEWPGWSWHGLGL